MSRYSYRPASKYLVIDFHDIDNLSWKWGDVFHITHCENFDKLMNILDANEKKSYIISLPRCGNEKYSGHHGIIEAACTLVAAGILEDDARIVTVLSTSDTAASDIAILCDHNCSVAYAQGFYGEQLLPVGAVELDVHARPPIVKLMSGKLSEAGIQRLMGGVAGNTLMGIKHTAPPCFTATFPQYFKFDLFDALTLHRFRGWWDNYDGIPRYGFGTNRLSMADLSAHPFFKDKIELPKYMVKVGEDIGRIWNHYWNLCHDSVDIDVSSPEAIQKTAYDLGMEPLLDIYFSGVPLDDIIA